jgi:hypothetical protein
VCDADHRVGALPIAADPAATQVTTRSVEIEMVEMATVRSLCGLVIAAIKA